MSCEYEKEKQKGSGNDREILGFQFLLARLSHFPTEQHSNCLDRKLLKPHLSLYELVLRYRVKTSPPPFSFHLAQQIFSGLPNGI